MYLFDAPDPRVERFTANVPVTRLVDLAAIPLGDHVIGRLHSVMAMEARLTRLGIAFELFDVRKLSVDASRDGLPNTWARRCCGLLAAHEDALGVLQNGRR